MARKLNKCNGCGVNTAKVLVTVECPNCGAMRKAAINSSHLEIVPKGSGGG